MAGSSWTLTGTTYYWFWGSRSRRMAAIFEQPPRTYKAGSFGGDSWHLEESRSCLMCHAARQATTQWVVGCGLWVVGWIIIVPTITPAHIRRGNCCPTITPAYTRIIKFPKREGDEARVKICSLILGQPKPEDGTWIWTATQDLEGWPGMGRLRHESAP